MKGVVVVVIFERIDRKVSVFFFYAGRHFPMTCNEA